jgi:UDP-N-acetyl-2-amino-2-deoxyglucuronate dehydrogenase
MKKFALIGAAGYIAPRHMRAIKQTNNILLAAMDKFDSVGIIDSYFPEASFFTEFERFDRHLDKLKRKGTPIDFVSICSPNYLHDAHIRFGLRNQADVICEKPLVLNPWNVEGLKEMEKESGQQIYNILQLRHHPSILALKKKITSSPNTKHYIDLTYITSRGKWYGYSWKGELSKSGGIDTNIGIHFFDMLIWIFGDIKQNQVHIHQSDCAAGYLELENAQVRWFLSINAKHLPEEIKGQNQRTFRSIKMEDKEMEFSDGFTDLHTVSYQNILSGNGFGISDTEKSIQLAHDIRNGITIGLKGDFHPYLLEI